MVIFIGIGIGLSKTPGIVAGGSSADLWNTESSLWNTAAFTWN